jgi:4-carboxy-3-alkylbut-2-enoyl-[acp] decarboxylase
VTVDVIDCTDIAPEIVQIKMHDRTHKNTFSPELIDGLTSAFKNIAKNHRYKVVILTGYDSYFSSGGMQDDLLDFSDGKGKFTDHNLYSLALDCQIPVICAMQGHGIGGGFVMGMFSDFVILSQESIYTTNFMKYGFTPGMGATLVLPEKLGSSLALEMMMAAKTYYGRDLERRGITFPVLPRKEVLSYAVELATTLAEKPRTSLITLKDHLVCNLRSKLQEVIDQELIMHEKTFSLPEVRKKIQTLFGH